MAIAAMTATTMITFRRESSGSETCRSGVAMIVVSDSSAPETVFAMSSILQSG